MYLYQIFVGGRHPHVIELVKGYELIVELVVYIFPKVVLMARTSIQVHTLITKALLYMLCAQLLT